MSELDFWMLFFPCECVDDILTYTNANLRVKQKKITKGELYKNIMIGLLYAMTLGVLRQRRDYWSTEGLFLHLHLDVDSGWDCIALSKFFRHFPLQTRHVMMTAGVPPEDW